MDRYDIHSEKYGIDGRVLDYSMVTKLEFTYNGREHSIGMSRSFGEKELADVGLRIMERTIESLLSADEPRTPTLHYWYVTENNGAMLAHGVVTGHPKLTDSQEIYTSPVSSIQIDSEREEAVIATKNTAYRCPLRYLRFHKQDKAPELVPGYEELKARYSGQIEMPEIEQGKVLLVLSDFDEYYFHSLCVKDENGKPVDYTGSPHVGTFQDSYLIRTGNGKVDLRYFPHFRNISFYSIDTDGMPLYAENIGGSAIFIKYSGHTFRLEPGVRMELCEENAAEKVHDLPNGDLYPAGIIE